MNKVMFGIRCYKNITQLLCHKLHIVSESTDHQIIIQKCLDQASLEPTIISFLNAHAFNLAVNDQLFLDSLSSSTWLFRDGVGISLLCRTLGIAPGKNMNGTDFIPQLLERAIQQKREIILLGTESPWLENAKKTLECKGGNVCFIFDGFQPNEFYINKINWRKFQRPIVVLAMGMPKQEKIANELVKHLPNGLILNAGAILDFLGGKVSRAPLILRKLRLEWLYRFLQEPVRLFGRYIIGNFVFLARIPKLLIVKSSMKDDILSQ
ncbi:WecB/TagA/CpsF family glycosyltransferase [Endozoicomonas sp. ALE010]|uniref:WecB/TagA/CpsF family glycosyltransferase n=1 Tax=Endozoicomonas sp. ALE010 TaxID=3403081 RepID=UPI003BB4EB39